MREKGIVGVWGDLGEPEVHPTALKHYNTSADEVHNIYGHDWAGLIYKGYKNDFSEELLHAKRSFEDYFGKPISIKSNGKNGKIEIKFKDKDDLIEILEKLK